jgi:hypothetical protein
LDDNAWSKTRSTRLLAAVTMTLGLAFPAQAGEAGEPVVVDGALLVRPARAGTLRRDSAGLAARGQNVSVTPGTYTERMTVWRPMRITRSGASGTVRIGG